MSSKEKRERPKQLSLGESYDDWKALKELGGWTHNQLARHLLDVHARHCTRECASRSHLEPFPGTPSSVQFQRIAVPARPDSLKKIKYTEVQQVGDDDSLTGEEGSEGKESSALSTDDAEAIPTGPQKRLEFSTPDSHHRDPAEYFASDVSSLHDSDGDSDGSLADAFDFLPEQNSELERSFVDEEVFNFVEPGAGEEDDGPSVEEFGYGRMTGECSAEAAVKQDKCIAYVDVLEDLIKKVVPKFCPATDCTGTRIFWTAKRGSCAVISWKCGTCSTKTSTGTWASQPRVGRMYAGNMVLPATVLMSGNNMKKIALMCKFAQLWFPNTSHFGRLQRLYFHPVIEEYWEESRRELLAGIPHGVVLAGDGRMDSPGHSAQYCTYSLMDHDRKCIITLQCVDVRQAKHSYDMERVGFLRAMDDVIRLGVKISEVVTDAHSQIKSIMKTEERFKNMLHQTDIWHASKLLVKKLSAAGKKKHCQALLLWMPSVRNHFWYACRTCEGDETKLKVTWSTVAQHLVNKHSWLDVEGLTDGGCDHEELSADREDKPWITPGTQAHMELLNVVFDKRFMSKMPYVKNFRHTSYVEAFHNHILMYASKRYSFSYTGYLVRNRLAAIDFNYHRNRGDLLDSSDNLRPTVAPPIVTGKIIHQVLEMSLAGGSEEMALQSLSPND